MFRYYIYQVAVLGLLTYYLQFNVFGDAPIDSVIVTVRVVNYEILGIFEFVGLLGN